MKILEDSKQDLVDNAGYAEIAIEDFYDLCVENVKRLEKLPEEHAAQENTDGGIKDYKSFVTQHLMTVLCNHDTANYIIMYARFLASAHIKKNSILFEGFLEGDIGSIGADSGPQRVTTFCTQQVE